MIRDLQWVAIMPAKKQLIRITTSVDKDDYAALGKLAKQMEVSASWLMRQAIRDLLDKYGTNGQPELALRLASRRVSRGGDA